MIPTAGDNARAGRESTPLLRLSCRLAHSASHLRFDMAQNDTLIIRAALNGKAAIYRDIEIEGSKSLHQLAEAIVSAFGFDFDHAFGFYSGLKPATMMRASPRYELFADMGDSH